MLKAIFDQQHRKKNKHWLLIILFFLFFFISLINETKAYFVTTSFKSNANVHISAIAIMSRNVLIILTNQQNIFQVMLTFHMARKINVL